MVKMNFSKFRKLIVRFKCQYKIFHHRSICILGIETSCDDTGVGIVNKNKEILGESINSQTQIHVQFGGILPPVARDLHKQNIQKVINEALALAKMSVNDVDAISVTNRPGLSLSLTVGLNYAKNLAIQYNKPIIPIHHMEAHALTARLTNNVTMPYLALLISGGHALLVLVCGIDNFLLLGEGLDDAPGEILDKVARRLSLKNHPDCIGVSGGRSVEILAEKFIASETKMEEIMPPIMHRWSDCNFSFSGIKTWAMQKIEKLENIERIRKNEILSSAPLICYMVQHAILRHIAKRIQRAIIYCELKELLPKGNNKTLVLSGGVASNMYIRKGLEKICNKYDCHIIAPPIKYCTDNGVMIAWNGVEKMMIGDTGTYNFADINIQPKCSLGSNLIDDVRNSNIKLPYFKLID